MKRLFIILVSFFTISAFAQTTIAKGIILNENTKSPIAYVNISILKSQIGVSSYEDGSYTIEILDEDIDKHIKLSSLGYQDSIISVLRFIKLKSINLKPLIEQLDEVVINKKFEEQLLIVNPIRRKDIVGGFTTGNNPWKLSLFFPYKKNYESTEYLKTVKLFLYHNIISKSRPSKFRLRLFSVDKNGLPGNDLVSESIIVETKKKEKEVEIDISKYNLSFPEEGFYIAFEWLHIPFNWYEKTVVFEEKKEKQIWESYSPIFSATKGEINMSRTAIFSSGKWFDNNFLKDGKGNFWIPAISLTLSN